MANSSTCRPGGSSGYTSTKYRLEVGAQLISMIGARTLEHLAGDLRPLACQTCHDPISGVADLSGDAVLATAEVVLSAHHASCRPSDVRVSKEMAAGTPTVVATAWVLSDGSAKGHAAGDVVVVVNPSCEQLIARQQGLLRRRWTNVTLNDLQPLGFKPAGPRPPNALQGVTAGLDGDRLTITANTTHTTKSTGLVHGAEPAAIDNTWVVSDLSGPVQDALATAQLITIAATMKVLPTALAQDNVGRGITDRTTMLGRVGLTRSVES